MQSPTDLIANDPWASSKSMQAKSLQLKRLSGGLATISKWGSWSDKELAALAKAIEILGAGSTQYAKASKVKADSLKQKEIVGERVKAASASTFGSIQSVEDKIALIDTTMRFVLKQTYDNPSSVDYLLTQHFKDALQGVVVEVVRRVEATPGAKLDQAIQEHLGALWAKYQEMRPASVMKHKTLIENIKAIAK